MDTRRLAIAVITAAALGAPDLASAAAARQSAAACQPWQACQQLALEARERGAYETFHDLAWRTVQIGPPGDHALMYLLARAQSLSGRRRDALIMLRRLAEAGYAFDAASDEDLRRTRELPGWREVEELAARAGTKPPPEPATASAPAARPPAKVLPEPKAAPPAALPAVGIAVAPAARAALARDARPAADVARFSADPFIIAGLAYDQVSRRFLLGDRLGRRLLALGEGSARTADLVRAETAGFHDVTALDIDARRGDLWVTSTTPSGDTAALHKLQLISGRTIATYDFPPASRIITITDLAIAAGGTVVVLDGAAPRVLRLRPGAKAVEAAMPLDTADARSIAVTDTDRVAYIAHRDGIIRLDLQALTAAPVTAPDGIMLAGFERIRWHGNALVGVQALPDESRALVRLQLNGAGRAVTGGGVIDPSLGRDERPPFVAVSGDDVYYSVVDADPASGAAGAMSVLVRRIRLP